MDVSVLIVGAGPVGMSLAIELGSRGIDCLLVEKRDGKLSVPKMSGVSPRAMEFCRRWGITDKVRAASIPEGHGRGIVYLTSLQGVELARSPPPGAGGTRDYTPESPARCAQIFFDPILAAHAKTLRRVTLRYHTSFESLTQHSDRVEAQLFDSATGCRKTIEARYVVGCDGANGTVRPALGIELEGLGTVAQSVNIFFRSPALATLHDKGWAQIYRTIDATGCWGELIPISADGLWRLTVFNDPEGAVDPGVRCRRLMGSDFPFEILSAIPWERNDYVAKSYGNGRVYIAGDAAHQCSPTGGLGMHTGMEEAFNLGWKLAAMLQGWGGPHLLASYQAERRPIAVRNVGLATKAFYAILAIPGYSEASNEEQTEWQSRLQSSVARYTVNESVKMQYTYIDSPVCAIGRKPVQVNGSVFAGPLPGDHVPHRWLTDGRSSLDLFGERFTLLRVGKFALQAGPFVRAASRVGMPLDLVSTDDASVVADFGACLTIVRPDGYVAWRSGEQSEDARAIVDRLRGAATS